MQSLEFQTAPGTLHRTGERFEAAKPLALPTSPEPFADVITIDGQAIDVEPAIVHGVISGLFKASQMIDESVGVDCMIFGTAVSGGRVDADVYRSRDLPYTVTTRYRAVAPIATAGRIARALQPTDLGKLSEADGSRILTVGHTVVALNPEADIYLQKLGDDDIVISGLALAAELYDCNTAGSVVSTRVRSAHHRVFFSFKAPDVRSIVPAAMEARMQSWNGLLHLGQ